LLLLFLLLLFIIIIVIIIIIVVIIIIIIIIIVYYRGKNKYKEKRKGRPKTIYTDEICGMTGEMGLKEGDWRDRENWRHKITGQS
jgi:hypothetical protein